MLIPQITLSAAREVAFKAMLRGSTEAHFAGDCERPRIIELRGVSSLLMRQLEALDDPFVDWADGYGWLPHREPRPEPPTVLTVAAKVRCRKCDRCLRQRARMWTARAIVETRRSTRTWFGTLTVAPERRFWAKASAEGYVARSRNETWDMLTPTERFRAIERFISPEITRWLKRVRKESSASLRYLVVSESHKDGFPHYHVLIHEAGSEAVVKRTLQSQWRWGFSKWNLVETTDAKACWYVCKYLTKSVQTRVRASRRFGNVVIG